MLLLGNWWAYLLVSGGLYLLTLFAYRLLFHPLRHYPGPFLAKLTNAYAGIHAVGMRLHLVTAQDHATYGPVVRVGPNKLLFNTATALRDIYDNDRLQKSSIYKLLPNATSYPNVFNIIDKHNHKQKRKLVGQAISDKAMRQFEPSMIEEIDIMISLVVKSCPSSSSHQAEPVNITTLCKRLGVDIIGKLAFGYDLNTQTDEEHRFLIPGLVAGNYRANLYLQWPTLKKTQIDWILTLFTRNQRLRYYDLVDKMLSSRLMLDSHAKIDLVSFLAQGLDTEALRDRENVVDILRWEGVFFFSAGSDTTTSATCALFFYLSQNPDAYKRLAAEIRGAGFKSAADIRAGPTLSACTYLRACIDEALRLSPPVTGALWRERDPSFASPLIVDGHVIPPGTRVGVNAYALHHNADYFPEPYEFKPDRWLTKNEAALKRMHRAFAAFSVGSRACAGKAMAYLEISLVIARTLWYLDFEAAPDELGRPETGAIGQDYGRKSQTEFQLYDVFASTHDGPPLIFKERGDHYKELGVGECHVKARHVI